MNTEHVKNVDIDVTVMHVLVKIVLMMFVLAVIANQQILRLILMLDPGPSLIVE